MTDNLRPAAWRLHCKHCGWAPDSQLPMSVVQQHMINRHGTDEVKLDLVPHCGDDDAPYEISESGDSGQCPECGRFEILRLPEEYR